MSTEDRAESQRHVAPRSWDLVVVGVVGLVAAAIPLLLRNGSFTGYGFNGAVYLSSSVHLLHGTLPYRDFVLIQPPGIALLLSPLSALSLLTGTPAIWVVARLVMIVVVAATCVLVSMLLRRFGTIASLVGGLFLATFSVAGSVSTQVKLEPFLIGLVLVGALLLFRPGGVATDRRAVWAGVLVGFAGLVKVWAVVPAVVMLALVAWQARSSLHRVVVGLAAGFLIPALPFLVASPSGFVHDVLVTQQQRTAGAGQVSSTGHRLAMLSYDAFRPFTPNLAVAAGVGLVASLGIAWFAVRQRHSLTAIEWFALGSLALSIAALLLAPESFVYYAYFPAPFLALVLGSMAAAGVRAFQARGGSGAPGERHRVLALVTVVVLALVIPFGVAQVRATRSLLAPLSPPGPSATISGSIPPGACVVTDDVYTTLMADRLTSTIPRCPVVVDAEGLWLSLAPMSPPPAPAGEVPTVTAAWKTALSGAGYVVLNRYADAYVPWTPALRGWFSAHFRLVAAADHLEVYKAR